MNQHPDNFAEWMRRLAEAQESFGDLAPGGVIPDHGYSHTLREIVQQPLVWPLADSIWGDTDPLEGAASVVLTGSGSSFYAAECVAPVLEAARGIPVQAVPGGNLLTEGARAFHGLRPCVFVWFARSGNSPESYGALDLLLERERDCRHVILTANSEGRLATDHAGDSRVRVAALDPRTCDKSLVMTSSFTSMVIAAQALARVRQAPLLARMARALLLEHSNSLRYFMGSEFGSAIFLGSGCLFGAAREASLKLQEMTAGRLFTFAETYLGLRHGPMSSVHEDTLLVVFLSSNALRRAYELDLLREIDRKALYAKKVIVGENIPRDIVGVWDIPIECPGMLEAGDDAVAPVAVVVGQLLAFFQCMNEGLHPDAPSQTGAISRVVAPFQLHRV